MWQWIATSVLTLVSVTALADANLVMYAHRGGVRIPGAPSNVIQGLELAISRGYQAVEIDLQETRDGVPVAAHGDGLSGKYAKECKARGFFTCEGKKKEICENQSGFPVCRKATCKEMAEHAGERACAISEIDWDELKEFRTDDGEYRISHLNEFLKTLSEAQLSVMLDSKMDLSRKARKTVMDLLKRYDLFGDVVLIGNLKPRLKMAKKGAGFVGLPKEALVWFFRLPFMRKGVPKDRFVLFQHGKTFDNDVWKYARKKDMLAIASVNWFHYGKGDKSDSDPRKEKAMSDIRRLYDKGVRHFQVDTEFDEWLFNMKRR